MQLPQQIHDLDSVNTHKLKTSISSKLKFEKDMQPLGLVTALIPAPRGQDFLRGRHWPKTSISIAQQPKL